MIARLQRLKARLRLWRSHDADLNRRVMVENRLLAAASGKEPLPDRNECRALAYKLGVPDEYRRDR